MTKTIAAAGIGVFICSLSLSAQNTDLNASIGKITTLPTSNAEYQLGPGDLIEIRVFGVDNFNQVQRVSASGTIRLPLLEPVAAAGLTAAELEQRLADKLDGDVIKNPQVSVFVKEYRSQPVTILGAVKTPGQYQISLQLRFVDILSLAGGLQPNADDDATIQRPSKNGEDEIIHISLRELLERGDLTLNKVVRGGDIIHIRAREDQFVYIVGEMNRPQAFVLPPKRTVRISEVYAWAGGASRTAKVSDSMLLRYDEAGQRQEIKVNFADVLKGKEEDLLVRDKDIIFVPGSKVKTFTQGLLAGLPGSVATIPYRIP
jgi:polysaccharide biosynthesis/export protein